MRCYLDVQKKGQVNYLWLFEPQTLILEVMKLMSILSVEVQAGAFGIEVIKYYSKIPFCGTT